MLRCHKIYMIVLLCSTFFCNAYSQKTAPVNFGKVTAGDFIINSPLVNENTNAVIIAEVGEVKFEGNDKGWFTYVYKIQKRVKILNRKAFDLADVSIFLYNNNETEEKAEKITAICYNIEDGKVSETKLSSKDIYTQKYDKNHSVKKFAIPGIKEGSVIEYSYIIKSEFAFNLPSWEFQSVDAPTLWSEYSVVIPGLLSYMTIVQGYHNFFINERTEGQGNYFIQQKVETGGYTSSERGLSVAVATTNQRWVMKDIPAFTIEGYVFCPANFIDKVSLQLYSTYDGENSHDVADNWKKLEEELSKREDFGEPLQDKKGWLKELVEKVVNENDTKIDAAKKIYNYVRQNYTCTDRNYKYIKTSLKDVINKKSGTIGDINLLLTALLKQLDIDAAPVLLSTRSFGYNSPTYPFMDKLNYTICKAQVNKEDYYLDATQPFLKFGKLPLACYNGHARVIAPDTPAVYFSPASLLESKLTNIVISNTADKQPGGFCKQQLGFFESLEVKNKIAISGQGTYLSEAKNSYSEEMEISNLALDSFQTDEGLVAVNYDLKLRSFKDADMVYFNPMLAEAIKTNPFYATERVYPVEMPYTRDDVYSLSMDIPEGYVVEELPKQTRVMLNENDGMFEYLITADKTRIQLRCKLQIKRTFFSSEDYKSLRDFYAYIVKKEAEQIVLKKIK